MTLLTFGNRFVGHVGIPAIASTDAFAAKLDRVVGVAPVGNATSAAASGTGGST